jgi:hypothetical protein
MASGSEKEAVQVFPSGARQELPLASAMVLDSETATALAAEPHHPPPEPPVLPAMPPTDPVPQAEPRTWSHRRLSQRENGSSRGEINVGV